MIYTIKNDNLSVSVSSLGAELWSILYKDKEMLWQGDKKYWGGRAPIMFPICGRLFEGKYTYRGKKYTMPNHGIARASEFTLSELTDTKMVLTLKSNEKTKESYPFDFTLDVCFTLEGTKLGVEYTVTNNEEKAHLIFALGGHPAFNVPYEDGTAFQDYYVEFSEPCPAKRVDFSPTCFCTHNDKLYTQGGTKRINLCHSLFDDDAIFLYDISKEITLGSEKSPLAITLSYEGMKYVGLWHAPKTDAPYLCIEPWSSIPATDGIVDDLESKKEMVHLTPEGRHKNGYLVRFTERN
ncbi:MAG: aldose 1-epimerase family protein [Clostridia bacterium]|nr:aldose 1-epimerase family protein [Clostridia bacterium]